MAGRQPDTSEAQAEAHRKLDPGATRPGDNTPDSAAKAQAQVKGPRPAAA
jgi:hypothetical protein